MKNNKLLIIFLVFIVVNVLHAGETGEPILRLNTKMHTAIIKRIDVDAKGKYLVTSSEDKTVIYTEPFCPNKNLTLTNCLQFARFNNYADFLTFSPTNLQ